MIFTCNQQRQGQICLSIHSCITEWHCCFGSQRRHTDVMDCLFWYLLLQLPPCSQHSFVLEQGLKFCLTTSGAPASDVSGSTHWCEETNCVLSTENHNLYPYKNHNHITQDLSFLCPLCLLSVFELWKIEINTSTIQLQE